MAKIYLITCQVNGKRYVGCTIRTVEGRWQDHRSQAQSGSPFALHRAIRRYGESSFKIEELATIHPTSDLDDLFLMESAYIAELQTFGPKGYNMTPGGEGGMFPRSEDTKAKMKAILRTPERRALSSKLALQMWQDKAAVCAKLVEGNKRRFADPQQRAKVAHQVKSQWQDPEYRRVQTEKLAKARAIRGVNV